MKIVIIYDTNATDYKGIDLLYRFVESLDEGHEVETIKIDYTGIMPCTGCFKCWTTTPGVCMNTKDAVNGISEKYIQSDLLILFSKVTYGGYSSDIKALLDRLIANISPFFTKIAGEMHHKKRYEDYPNLIALGYGEMTEAERITFTELIRRNALNMHPRKYLALTVQNPEEMDVALREVNEFMNRGEAK